MKQNSFFWFRLMVVTMMCIHYAEHAQPAHGQTGAAAGQSKPAEILIPGGLVPTRLLLQSPAETVTELQIICLFESAPENRLHGSLIELNEKLKGLLDQIRKPTLFRGDLGETLLIEPREGNIGAKRLLIIGLGDSPTFTPQRMELIGAIAYREANRLAVAHPYFAPTVLDGGVSTYSAGLQSEEFITGFLRAARTEKILKGAGASSTNVLRDLTFLAGAAHAADAEAGIEKAFAAADK